MKRHLDPLLQEVKPAYIGQSVYMYNTYFLAACRGTKCGLKKKLYIIWTTIKALFLFCVMNCVWVRLLLYHQHLVSIHINKIVMIYSHSHWLITIFKFNCSEKIRKIRVLCTSSGVHTKKEGSTHKKRGPHTKKRGPHTKKGPHFVRR